LLSKDQAYEILVTGPLSNIAEALARDPSIKSNIKHLFVMGGAVNVAGNVKKSDHDSSAEWNFYNHPIAAKYVFESGIPITIVPLDITNKAPFTRDFLDALREQAKTSETSKLFYDAWMIIAPSLERANADYFHTYFFWDTLTAAVAIEPSLVKSSVKKLTVISEGESQGKTLVTEDGDDVTVAEDVNAQELHDMVLNLLM